MTIRGFWWDNILRKVGDKVIRQVTPIHKNQICIGMTRFLSWAFVQDPATLMTFLRHAIGAGDGAWAVPPAVDKSDTALDSEFVNTRRNYDGLDYIKAGIGQGTAAGTTTTLIDDQRYEPTAWFNGLNIEITAGTNVGQTRTISDWDLTTKTFTVSVAFALPCDDTSEYRIVPAIHTAVSGAVQIRTVWPFGVPADPFNGITIREQGIFYDETGVTLPVTLPSGTMLNKIYHAPIVKNNTVQLERFVRFIFDIPRG